MRGALWWIAGGVFVVLATANAAGYRYGVSDQAFYIPVVARALDPAAFPRDGSLIDAQGRLMVTDEAIAAVVRATGLPLHIVFFAGYLLSLGILWAGLVLIGTHLSRSVWLTIAIGAAFTLRHRIPRTSANSFEPYFHPRMLAFAIGTLAIAALLRQRPGIAVALVAAASVVHVTTALWFAVLVGTAVLIGSTGWNPRKRFESPPVEAARPAGRETHGRLRRAGWIAAAAGAAVAAWAVTAGPLQSSLTVMDPVWLEAVSTKDSLFPLQWPLWAWAANLGLLAVLWWAHARRERAQQATREDAALVWGASALVALVLITLPLVTYGFALLVQLQITRVFWLVDLLALVYLLAALGASRPHVARAMAIVLIMASAARGVYILTVERPERSLFAIALPANAWQDAMAWLSRQPLDVHVLADPGHAWMYDTSVRVSAGRDVFLEDVKDSAIAIYSRAVAERVVERRAAVGDFGALTASRARALAREYDLDYLVTENDLPLPEAYRNERFRIYALAAADGPSLAPHAPVD